MHGFVHVKLQKLRGGGMTERRFRLEERFEEVELDRQTLEFLYDEADQCIFMHPETYEQVSLPKESLGPFLPFLQPNQQLQVEFLEEEPVKVCYPSSVDLRVESTPDALHHVDDSGIFKNATLENGTEVQVPQFIKVGDTVRIDVETGKYLERVR